MASEGSPSLPFPAVTLKMSLNQASSPILDSLTNISLLISEFGIGWYYIFIK